ncbi:hypothetical protein MJM59_28130, partial [Salmonella enterica subsp. enterica serovar Montevideo]|nr:hypothetical protein [Salmonella enterica subsp. enterica serovar Montevideo]
ARQGQVATVLSAPAKITNHLVAMIEKTIGGQDALPNISDAERRGENGLKIIMMCEIPSNALLAEQFLEYFDGFSIGSNDMTQLA